MPYIDTCKWCAARYHHGDLPCINHYKTGDRVRGPVVSEALQPTEPQFDLAEVLAEADRITKGNAQA